MHFRTTGPGGLRPGARRFRLNPYSHPIYRRSVAFLYRDSGQRDQPFFLQVSFTDPHHPFTPPGKYWDMYDPADIPLPQSFGQITTPRLEQVHELHAAGEHERKGGFAMPVNGEERAR